MRPRMPAYLPAPSSDPLLAVERAARRRGCAVSIGDEADVGAHLGGRAHAAASLVLAVGCCHGWRDAQAVGLYARRRLTIARVALGSPLMAAAVERLAALLALSPTLGGYARRSYAVDLWGGVHELETEAGEGEETDGPCPGCLLAAAREVAVARRVADVRRLALLPGANVWAMLPGMAPARLIS